MFDADGPASTSLHPNATYVASFEPGDRPSEAIIAAVAELTGADALDLSPLYDAVEPDALDALFEHARRADDPGSQRLAFAYAGFDIEVCGDGSIRLTTLADVTTADDD